MAGENYAMTMLTTRADLALCFFTLYYYSKIVSDSANQMTGSQGKACAPIEVSMLLRGRPNYSKNLNADREDAFMERGGEVLDTCFP